MNQGMQEGGAGLATTEDPYNASVSIEVADYSNDLPVIDPPIPIPASQRVDFILEQENSDARLHNPGGEVNQSEGGVDYVLEIPVLANDVIRAGGLGPMDELGSVLVPFLGPRINKSPSFNDLAGLSVDPRHITLYFVGVGLIFGLESRLKRPLGLQSFMSFIHSMLNRISCGDNFFFSSDEIVLPPLVS
ncbi:hypothetical protein R1sor_003999 [Riccia sorocarpa]|uniref:Uncharacterized protein n=1 Tax=Riccia sorocarpa TaxID=122646 RepID=A0ABD3H622_9MARC